MRILVLTILSVLAMNTVMPYKCADAVVTPSVSDAEKRENQMLSDPNVHEKFKQIDFELQKTVSEMENEQTRHTESLENMKKELQQLQLRLNAQESQTKTWVPARVAWVLDKDTK